MINRPLTSGDHGKILLFFLLFSPVVVIGAGLIPAIFLVFGIYMMRKNKDFKYIETAVKFFSGYVGIFLIFFFVMALIMGYQHVTRIARDPGQYDPEMEYDYFLICTAYVLLHAVYLMAIKWLFYNPLYQHRDWVAVNCIFATSPKSIKVPSSESEVDIIKGEKLKHYSVADELIKWTKLKEDGHISENEFNEARAKILKRI